MITLAKLVARFRWEPDNWWWEKVRPEELGLPAAFGVQIPDKLAHFTTCFMLTWLFYKLGLGRIGGALVALVLMVPLWELLWDGCYRYGASWRDLAADVLGTVVAVWWLGSYDVVGQVTEIPTRLP
jgi:VanZ family protein